MCGLLPSIFLEVNTSNYTQRVRRAMQTIAPNWGRVALTRFRDDCRISETNPPALLNALPFQFDEKVFEAVAATILCQSLTCQKPNTAELGQC